MKKPRSRSAMFFFADATSALMAGTFVLACALIKTDSSSEPPVTANGMMRLEISMLDSELANRIDLCSHLKLRSVTFNGQQLVAPLPAAQSDDTETSSPQCAFFRETRRSGQVELQQAILLEEGVLRVETSVTNMLKPCSLIAELEWNNNINPTPWPGYFRAVAVGSAINRDAKDLLKEGPLKISREDSQAGQLTFLRITMVFNPALRDRIVRSELVNFNAESP